jgi:hypothetical protein
MIHEEGVYDDYFPLYESVYAKLVKEIDKYVAKAEAVNQAVEKIYNETKIIVNVRQVTVATDTRLKRKNAPNASMTC